MSKLWTSTVWICRLLLPATLVSAIGVFSLAALQATSASAATSLCLASKHDVMSDRTLRDALEPAFGRFVFKNNEQGCLYPFKILAFDKADVLLVSGSREDPCHACSVDISAFVLARSPTIRRLVAKLSNFTQSGSWKTPGDITSLKVGGDDALMITEGWAGQGAYLSTIRFFAFRQGGISELKFPGLVYTTYSDVDALTEKENAVSIDGNWKLEGPSRDVLSIDYKIQKRNQTHDTHVSWQLNGNSWTLNQGKNPSPENPGSFDVKPTNNFTNVTADLRPDGVVSHDTVITSGKAQQSEKSEKELKEFTDIRSLCDSKWDDNYEMVLYCVKNQKSALYNLFSSLDDRNKPIAAKCLSKWTDGSARTNWEMTKYCFDEQIKAYNELNQ